MGIKNFFVWAEYIINFDNSSNVLNNINVFTIIQGIPWKITVILLDGVTLKYKTFLPKYH